MGRVDGVEMIRAEMVARRARKEEAKRQMWRGRLEAARRSEKDPEMIRAIQEQMEMRET